MKIGYARVSTIEQNLDLQRDALLAAGCERVIADTTSGAVASRPGLEKVKEQLRAGDTLVVWRLDRLGRTLTGVLEVLEQIEKQGVHFVSLTEKFDTSSSFGKAMLHMALTFAQLERDLISERTKAGMAVAKARGARFGQPSKIADNPRRLAEARLIVEEGVENISAAEAIARLNAADPKAKPIKSTVTWGRWLKDGCPGADD